MMYETTFGGMGRSVRLLVALTALAVASGSVLGCAQPQGHSQRDEIRTLESKARSGDIEAQYQLGAAYLDGHGVPADEFAAEKWLTRASNGGNTAAYIRLLPIIKERESRN